MTKLADLQSWFQQLIVSTDTDFTEPALLIDSHIKSTANHDAESRVWIYRGMYPMRMVEALQIDFSGVRSALGEEHFEWLVMEYVQRFPSRSWTLNRLGDNFPKFLGEQRLVRGRRFLSELATLELSLCQVFDAPPQECLSAKTLQDLTQEAGSNLILKPVAATALHSFSYPVSTYLARSADPSSGDRCRPQRERVLAYRRGYEMGRMLVSDCAYGLLGLLWRGSTLGAALDSISRRFPDVQPEAVQGWFRLWAELGIFAAPARDPRPDGRH